MTVDPTWITAASTVLGAALQSQPAGPSRADGRSTTGGFFDFGAPFVVTTGGGGAASLSAPMSAGSSILWIAGAIAAGVVAWKLWTKS